MQHTHICLYFILLVTIIECAKGDWLSEVPFWPKYPLRSTAQVIKVLDGVWEFGFTTNYNGDVTSTNVNTNLIQTPNRTNVPGVFDYVDPGFVGIRGTAFYRTQVNITVGRSAMINFAACSFYCNVFVDNKSIGDHRAGGYSPFWLSIPPSQSQTRTILVIVDNRFNSTTAPLHGTGDFYQYGGIHRSVIVHQLPYAEKSIWRVEVLPTACNDGVMANVNIILSGNFNGQLLVQFNSDVKYATVFRDGLGTITNLKVLRGCDPYKFRWYLNPKPVSAVFGLFENGTLYDNIVVRFAWTDTTGHTFRGFTMHADYPGVGPSLTKDQISGDIAMYMELDANYARTHHPQDQRFLDACDDAGIAVWEEPLGSGLTLQNLQDPYFMKYYMIQLDEMISASINHPSVVFWGIFPDGPSNDSHACSVYKTVIDYVKSRDKHRFVTWSDSHGLDDKCLLYSDFPAFSGYPGWFEMPGNTTYVDGYWRNLDRMTNRIYNKRITISATGCPGVYEWSNQTNALWTQSYQDMLIYRSLNNICQEYGILMSVIADFADYKANDAAQKTCGPCKYKPGTHDAIDINVKCDGTCGLSCKPCGRSHMGIVDYWRRPKEAYTTVKNFYHDIQCFSPI